MLSVTADVVLILGVALVVEGCWHSFPLVVEGCWHSESNIIKRPESDRRIEMDKDISIEGFDPNAVLIVGGWKGGDVDLASGEVLRQGGKQGECFIPPLPHGGSNSGVMILTPGDKKVLYCGGNGPYSRLCLELDVQNGAWKQHSTLPGEAYINGVTLENGVYLLKERSMYFLPRLSRSWRRIELDHTLPYREYFCVVKTSETGFHIIGQTSWKYDTLTYSWTKLESLGIHAIYGLACAIFNNKIIVTGGYNGGYLSTTVVIPLKNGNVAGPARNVGNMSLEKTSHRMAVVGGKYPRLMVLGGWDDSTHRSIEVWQPDEEKWKMAPYEMSMGRSYFGILAVPDALVCQKSDDEGHNTDTSTPAP